MTIKKSATGGITTSGAGENAKVRTLKGNVSVVDRASGNLRVDTTITGKDLIKRFKLEGLEEEDVKEKKSSLSTIYLEVDDTEIEEHKSEYIPSIINIKMEGSPTIFDLHSVCKIDKLYSTTCIVSKTMAINPESTTTLMIFVSDIDTYMNNRIKLPEEYGHLLINVCDGNIVKSLLYNCIV